MTLVQKFIFYIYIYITLFLKHDNCRNFHPIAMGFGYVVKCVKMKVKFVNGRNRSRGVGRGGVENLKNSYLGPL